MSTATFAAYNGLLSIIQTAVVGLVDADKVIDGPQPILEETGDYVLVGCPDPLIPGAQVAVTTGQRDWLDLGALNEKETFAIMSSIVTSSGDNDLTGCRSRAAAIVAVVDAALKTNGALTPNGIQLGGALAPTGWCVLNVAGWNQINYASGVAIHAQIVVSCTTRITNT